MFFAVFGTQMRVVNFVFQIFNFVISVIVSTFRQRNFLNFCFQKNIGPDQSCKKCYQYYINEFLLSKLTIFYTRDSKSCYRKFNIFNGILLYETRRPNVVLKSCFFFKLYQSDVVCFFSCRVHFGNRKILKHQKKNIFNLKYSRLCFEP